MANTIARRSGLNASSKGQLMKTALAAGGLGPGRLATRPLGLRPQTVADNFRNGRPLPSLRDNPDATIQDGLLGSV